MKKILLPAVGAVVLSLGLPAKAQTIADWTFETSQPAGTGSTVGPFSPETGTGSATVVHASSAAVTSAPAGNGSSHSFSSNNFAVGDYYQFEVSSLSLQDLEVTFDQTSSNTGPKDFAFEYSTNGTTFTTFTTYSVLADASPNTPWSSSGSPNSAFTFTEDLSDITALDNASTVYFRLVDEDTTSANGGTVGTSGTDRVDNFDVTAVATPEPASWMLGGIVLGALAFLRLRRRAA